MSINIRGRIYTNRLMNIYREFHVTVRSNQYTHEISKEMATIEQIKNGLIDKIQSIKNREFLEVLDRLITNNATAMENSKKISIEDLPREIVDILNMSDLEKQEDCIEHTSSRDILNRK